MQLNNKPVFKFNPSTRRAQLTYPLSHTQFFMRSSNGQVYRVVMDNLFYTYLSNAQAGSNRDNGIIADFTRRWPLGTAVEACGKLVASSTPTVHFVHPSLCPATKFSGFLHLGGLDISTNTKYCSNCACKLR